MLWVLSSLSELFIYRLYENMNKQLNWSRECIHISGHGPFPSYLKRSVLHSIDYWWMVNRKSPTLRNEILALYHTRNQAHNQSPLEEHLIQQTLKTKYR
ncbi:hypothetical protein AVEN_223782-1 [Araneus ventricosus]|uniref:Uncharacterized protein n=1 Tax=Araneus ventricosus TaxID=182803 RepID=A0A4Y2DNN2_ARAVE|nr:hypothetical protein AVEN_223782-1 [Araneus ventricosus]